MKAKLINLALFSVAMAMLESAVVIYLRALYYPSGFKFPIETLGSTILITELFRELATIIMLGSIGYMNGETKTERFTAFLFSFGIWDIFYYVFLKVFLNWPASILDWDLLFLLPVPWIGPVLAPCLVSASFIGLHLLVLFKKQKGINLTLHKTFWTLSFLGFAVMLYTFMADSTAILIEIYKSDVDFDLLSGIRTLIPKSFNWPIFLLGEIVFLGGISTLQKIK
ncbi:MAG: hypothetical protein FGM41_02655 [Bacteroidetes bacterium]|nr:hypothetical protein [Bacteroidota bacterium]